MSVPDNYSSRALRDKKTVSRKAAKIAKTCHDLPAATKCVPNPGITQHRRCGV